MKSLRKGFYCVGYGCNNKKIVPEPDNGDSTLTFFTFPGRATQSALRKIWVRNCRWRDWDPGNRAYICSEHFEPQCFREDEHGKKILKENACPTLFNFPTASDETLEEMAQKRMKKNKLVRLKKRNMMSFRKDCSAAKVMLHPLKFETLAATGNSNNKYIVSLDVPPMALLPKVESKLTLFNNEFKETNPRKVELPPGYVYSKPRGLKMVHGQVARAEHNYCLPSSKDLKVRINALVEKNEKQAELLVQRHKDMLKMKKRMMTLERKLSQKEKVDMPHLESSSIQDSFDKTLDEIIGETEPPKSKYPKMMSRKTQTRIKDFDGQNNIKSDDEAEVLLRPEEIKERKKKKRSEREKRKRMKKKRMKLNSFKVSNEKLNANPSETNRTEKETQIHIKEDQITEDQVVRGRHLPKKQISLRSSSDDAIEPLGNPFVEGISSDGSKVMLLMVHQPGSNIKGVSEPPKTSDVSSTNEKENQFQNPDMEHETVIMPSTSDEIQKGEDVPPEQSHGAKVNTDEEEEAIRHLLSSSSQNLPSAEDLFEAMN